MRHINVIHFNNCVHILQFVNLKISLSNTILCKSCQYFNLKIQRYPIPMTVHTKNIALPDLSKIGYCAVPDLHKSITRSLSHLELS